MKNKTLIVAALILIGLAGGIYLVLKYKRADKSGKKIADYVVPELKMAQMQLTNLTAERADLEMKMIIDNPAPIGIKIDSLFYIISIADQEVARSTYPDSLRVRARDSTNVSLPLTLYHNKLSEVLKSLDQQGEDSTAYKIKATIFTNLPLIPKDKLTMTLEKRLPLIRPPVIQVTDIKLKDVGLKGATMVVETSVRNRNIFSVGFEDISYRVQIDNNGWMEGSKPGTIKIPAKGTATINIPIDLKLKEMGKNLIDLIRKGGDVEYDFQLKTKLASDAHFLKDSKIALNAAGKLKTVADAVKEHTKDSQKN